ncbi:glycosyltransferase [Paenibacillus piri]|uniref:glycosyltransferase n=1 Tax=Paenibacillus piri TaxID=2547395 RepID=UPI001FE8169E|nr:glycosyltransferase [Paenibacillus piri]
MMVGRSGMSGYLSRFSNVPHRQMPDYFSVIGDSGGFLLSTSIMEEFGYAVTEAMSCRCPVISTDSDSMRSFITHNETGKFFSLGRNEEAVSQAMELFADKSLREKIQTQGVGRIRQQFTPQAYCDHFTQMLRALGVR